MCPRIVIAGRLSLTTLISQPNTHVNPPVVQSSRFLVPTTISLSSEPSRLRIILSLSYIPPTSLLSLLPSPFFRYIPLPWPLPVRPPSRIFFPSLPPLSLLTEQFLSQTRTADTPGTMSITSQLPQPSIPQHDINLQLFHERHQRSSNPPPLPPTSPQPVEHQCPALQDIRSPNEHLPSLLTTPTPPSPSRDLALAHLPIRPHHRVLNLSRHNNMAWAVR